uniref:Hyaluronidase n=1 Tax=Xenopus laevis TaxID=8355 RepID=B7ZQD4_XENLA|nr:LOC398285 protein [Xenopus laevis]AAI69795.1 LOC398285 protein [Xenopus laevis]
MRCTMAKQNIETIIFQHVLCKKCICILLFCFITSCQPMDIKAPTNGLSNFMAIWNAPTELCMQKFKVKIDVSLFQIVGTTFNSSIAQNITIFYTDRLGHYPSINETNGKISKGGIPQLTNMAFHLKKAKEDIEYYLPSSKQHGLAVIDWEEWRPLYTRNWASKAVYKKQSIEFAQQMDITMTHKKAVGIAAAQFESAAKNLMLETLKLGKTMRPNYLWGFYLFPNCYNYHYKSNPKQYTGHCPKLEIQRNDKLHWLWKESTALFPNIYLEVALKSSSNAALFARHRIQEARRLSTFSKYAVPIYVYTRPVFTNRPDEFLSEVDLANVIGEIAALGADGFVMWGDVINMTQSKKACTDLNSYLLKILNPYIINVTLAAKLCSHVLCQDNGLCTRKHWNTNTYLHLNSKTLAIEQKNGKYTVEGNPTYEDLTYFSKNFKCLCYAGRTCKEPIHLQNIGLVNICLPKSNICIKANFDAFSSKVMKISNINFSPTKPTSSILKSIIKINNKNINNK